MRKWLLLLLVFVALPVFACEQCINLYTWTNYFPQNVLAKFEKQTGIHVVVSYFSSNDEMYAKLKASNNHSGYDLIVPSSYYVPRMAKEGMLAPLVQSKIKNIRNINPAFLGKSYDPGNRYTIPLYWGATGIVINRAYLPDLKLSTWAQLWDPKFKNQLFMLNDDRELFAVSFITLGISPNTRNPDEIKKGYEHLKRLMPNIKLFNSDAIRPLFLGEDVTIGMAWTSDTYHMQQANPKLQFIYPKDGYTLWVDTLAIAKNAPHYQEAMRFMHYVLEPKVAASMAKEVGTSTPNAQAVKLLPKQMQESKILYPDNQIVKRGVLQKDIGAASTLYAKYWEMLKLQG